MNYRRVGRYGLKVSEIALGNWLTQGRTIDQETTNHIVRRAFELGVNFFDTSNNYHNGAAETALGIALDGVRREDLVIATKCFFPIGEGPNDRGLSRKHITESVHASLTRLKTDYVDILQFHRYDSEAPVDESVRAVNDLINQGKLLYWGVSEWNPQELAEAASTAERLGAHPPISNQPSYSMLNKTIENGVLAVSKKHGMGQVVFSPLAQGVLTGKYLPGQPPEAGTRAADDDSNMFMKHLMSDEVLTKVQSLKGFAEVKGLTLPQLALAWCLRDPGVSAVIVGASRVEQLEANVSASGVTLSPEDWKAAEAILA